MRTKTLLMLAGAALALSLATSQAQVYSANIVGYVNQPFVGPAGYTACVAPLVGTNANAETLLPALNTGDTILIWTGNGYYSDEFLATGVWLDSNNNTTNAPNLLPGEGFFYYTGSFTQETNTYVGTVALTNSVNFSSAAAYYLVGSTPPIAGFADSTNYNLPFQTGDTILIWTGNGYYSDEFLATGVWLDSNNNTTNAPPLNVGQGFFYYTGSFSSEVWTQNLSWVQ